jgi:hypothetical protein
MRPSPSPDAQERRPVDHHSDALPRHALAAAQTSEDSHQPIRCRPCGGGGYLTVADEWRRWALDYGWTIGSRRAA